MAPERPDWCLGMQTLNVTKFCVSWNTTIFLITEYDDENGEPDDTANDEVDKSKDDECSTSSEGMPKKRRRKEFNSSNATFMAGIQGVTLVTDQV